MAYDLGIIVPVYRSRESVRILVQRLKQLFQPDVKIRIGLVDDSHDPETAEYLERNCLEPEVSLWVLDNNYGQQAAVLCGLEQLEPCRYYATIDDDLEQPPERLKEMYEQIQEGYDLIYAVADRKKRPWYRLAGSFMRDRLFVGLLGAPAGLNISSFRLMTDKIVREACAMKRNGFFYLSAAIFLNGKKSGSVIKAANFMYEQNPRYQGESGYGFWSLFHLYKQILWNYYLNQRGDGRNRPIYRIEKTVRPPKLMILGGSNCQIHGVELASALGIDTVLVDYTENPPAAKPAGFQEQVSTFNIQACIEAAARHRVTGVLTMGTDQPVYTAACVCREYGLPAMLSREEAFCVTNKKKMKQILSEAGIPTVPWTLIGYGTPAEELAGLKPPYVIKPLDSQGQRGIFKVDTPGEVLACLPKTLSWSRCKEALAEEFYQSDEVTVSGWMKEGNLFLLTVTDRLLYPDPVHIGVCIGHRFPSVHRNRYEEIETLSQRVVSAFHLKEGPFYLQILIGKEGVRVNELACRIGGAFEDVFIPYITGFDILKAVLDSAMGRQVSTENLRTYRGDRSSVRIALQLLFCKPGTIASITPLETLKKLPYILDAGYNYSPGQTLPVMENATARFGHAVICGTEEDIGDRVDDFYQQLSVVSTEGEELLCRYYPEETEKERRKEAV